MPHYCDIAPGHPIHGPYHDKEYGFPSKNESVIFERMALEIMQAGLSWEIVLKKRAAMKKAFDGFDVDQVAAYTPKDVERLLAEEGIIRNRKKIEAIIANAATIQTIRASQGSFAKWLDSHDGQGKEAWVKVMRKTFRFMGPEIVGEFLMSLGYLDGAHHETCPVYVKIRKRRGEAK
jgi:DNA-3-methyladenine glycosylase I